MKQKILQLLKTNAVTLILFFVTLGLIWRNNVLHEREMKLNLDNQTQQATEDKKIALDSISKLNGRLKDIEIKSQSDSIVQYETIKKNGKPYQTNLTHIRLLAIRDSLRKISR